MQYPECKENLKLQKHRNGNSLSKTYKNSKIFKKTPTKIAKPSRKPPKKLFVHRFVNQPAPT